MARVDWRTLTGRARSYNSADAIAGTRSHTIGGLCLPPIRRSRSSLPLAQPRLLDRVREKIRLLHYSKRTEEAYVGWIRKFILFHGKRHPETIGATGSRTIPHAFGGRPTRRCQHPKSGPLRDPLPVQSTRATVAAAGRNPCQTSLPPAHRAFHRRNPTSLRTTPSEHDWPDGGTALRDRDAPARMRPAPCERHRLHSVPDHRTRGEGRQRPGCPAAHEIT